MTQRLLAFLSLSSCYYYHTDCSTLLRRYMTVFKLGKHKIFVYTRILGYKIKYVYLSIKAIDFSSVMFFDTEPGQDPGNVIMSPTSWNESELYWVFDFHGHP